MPERVGAHLVMEHVCPYVRVAVVFISGPFVVIWVLFRMNKVHNADKVPTQQSPEIAGDKKDAAPNAGENQGIE